MFLSSSFFLPTTFPLLPDFYYKICPLFSWRNFVYQFLKEPWSLPYTVASCSLMVLWMRWFLFCNLQTSGRTIFIPTVYFCDMAACPSLCCSLPPSNYTLNSPGFYFLHLYWDNLPLFPFFHSKILSDKLQYRQTAAHKPDPVQAAGLRGLWTLVLDWASVEVCPCYFLLANLMYYNM